jgi:hypothetical protein
MPRQPQPRGARPVEEGAPPFSSLLLPLPVSLLYSRSRGRARALSASCTAAGAPGGTLSIAWSPFAISACAGGGGTWAGAWARRGGQGEGRAGARPGVGRGRRGARWAGRESRLEVADGAEVVGDEGGQLPLKLAERRGVLPHHQLRRSRELCVPRGGAGPAQRHCWRSGGGGGCDALRGTAAGAQRCRVWCEGVGERAALGRAADCFSPSKGVRPAGRSLPSKWTRPTFCRAGARRIFKKAQERGRWRAIACIARSRTWLGNERTVPRRSPEQLPFWHVAVRTPRLGLEEAAAAQHLLARALSVLMNFVSSVKIAFPHASAKTNDGEPSRCPSSECAPGPRHLHQRYQHEQEKAGPAPSVCIIRAHL